jgi:hypothetical protein
LLKAARIQHLGDVWMAHHRHRLALSLEPRDHLPGVHAQLDHLQRHAKSHRIRLLRDIDHAAPAFADAFQSCVAPERLADGFVGRIGEIELDGRASGFGLSGEQRFGLLMRGE